MPLRALSADTGQGGVWPVTLPPNCNESNNAKPSPSQGLNQLWWSWNTASNHCELLHIQHRSSPVNPGADKSAAGRDRPKHSSYVGQIHSWGHFLLAVWKSWIILPDFRGFSTGHVAKRNPSGRIFVWFRPPFISPHVKPAWEIELWNKTNLCCSFCAGKCLY